MGTTLTGTTPQDTYDSLIKVTDNGPLTGSLKKLTDGLGNDSSLSLSTAAASLSGTLAVTGTSTFNSGQNVLYASFDNDAALFQRVGAYGAVVRLGRSGVSQTATIDYPADGTFAVSTAGVERIRATAAGDVGIGTSAPAFKLDVVGTIKANENAPSANGNGLVLRNQGGGGGESVGLVLSAQNQQANSQIRSTRIASSLAEDIQFFTGTNNVSTEKVRILAGGGITFNGDTAAANALDDYEEGTWTPNFTLISGTVTAHTASGSYTKIGRQVSLTLSITFTTTLLAEIDSITGMPFTAQNTAQIAIGAIRENSNTGDMWQLRINANGTSGALRRYDNDTSIANGDIFIGTLTYFV
jgi:hypothetical protein